MTWNEEALHAIKAILEHNGVDPHNPGTLYERDWKLTTGQVLRLTELVREAEGR